MVSESFQNDVTGCSISKKMPFYFNRCQGENLKSFKSKPYVIVSAECCNCYATSRLKRPQQSLLHLLGLPGWPINCPRCNGYRESSFPRVTPCHYGPSMGAACIAVADSRGY